MSNGSKISKFSSGRLLTLIARRNMETERRLTRSVARATKTPLTAPLGNIRREGTTGKETTFPRRALFDKTNDSSFVDEELAEAPPSEKKLGGVAATSQTAKGSESPVKNACNKSSASLLKAGVTMEESDEAARSPADLPLEQLTPAPDAQSDEDEAAQHAEPVTTQAPEELKANTTEVSSGISGSSSLRRIAAIEKLDATHSSKPEDVSSALASDAADRWHMDGMTPEKAVEQGKPEENPTADKTPLLASTPAVPPTPKAYLPRSPQKEEVRASPVLEPRSPTASLSAISHSSMVAEVDEAEMDETVSGLTSALQGMRIVSASPQPLRGLPVPQGVHIRFDEDEPVRVSPRDQLRGIPKAAGKHTRFDD